MRATRSAALREDAFGPANLVGEFAVDDSDISRRDRGALQ